MQTDETSNHSAEMVLMWGNKTLEDAIRDGDVVIHDLNVEAINQYERKQNV